jgi:hypothetical protein
MKQKIKKFFQELIKPIRFLFGFRRYKFYFSNDLSFDGWNRGVVRKVYARNFPQAVKKIKTRFGSKFEKLEAKNDYGESESGFHLYYVGKE